MLCLLSFFFVSTTSQTTDIQELVTQIHELQNEIKELTELLSNFRSENGFFAKQPFRHYYDSSDDEVEMDSGVTGGIWHSLPFFSQFKLFNGGIQQAPVYRFPRQNHQSGVTGGYHLPPKYQFANHAYAFKYPRFSYATGGSATPIPFTFNSRTHRGPYWATENM